MSAPDRDDEFEAFLQRRTLSPPGDDAPAPPPALDEIVLQKARAAIQESSLPLREVGSQSSRNAHLQSTRAARWATPVALAATILLCLSIVLNITLNTNRPTRSPVALEATAPQSAATAPPAAATPAPANKPGARAEPAREKAVVPQRAAPSAAGTLGEKREMEAAADRVDERKAGAAATRPQDPKAWLQRIDALRAEGKTAEADTEMQRFRAAFPTYPVKPAAPDAR